MARNRDPLALSPNWHLDLRLEAELPEDNVIRTRFVVGAAFGTIALGSLLLLAWVGYTRSKIQAEIADWDRQAAESETNVHDVELIQTEFEAEAVKVEKAAKIIRRRLLFSDFAANVAQTLPATMALDQIQLTEDGLKIGGQLTSPPDFARYVSTLNQSPKFSGLFNEIKQTRFERARSGDAFIFEITFRFRAKPGS